MAADLRGRFDHVGLNVRDLDRAIAWYTDAFGLRVEQEGGVDKVGFRFVMLKAPDGFRLELLTRTGSAPGLRAADALEAALTEGYGHVALEVPDLDAMFHHLVGKGATPIWDPRPAPVPRSRMAWVADPEGNLIELLHRDED